MGVDRPDFRVSQEMPTPSPLKERAARLVLMHLPQPGHGHPNGSPFAYCKCGEAIVELAGVWWHLYRAHPRDEAWRPEREA